jgi:hypothetical protein
LEIDMLQEIGGAIVLLILIWLGRGASKADAEWYDAVERHRRGED